MAGAARLSGGDARFQIEIDLVADLAVVDPFDFFVEAYAEAMPFAYPAELQHELALSRDRARGREARGLSRHDRARGAEHGRLPGRPQSAPAGGCRLHGPAGARRADARRDARRSALARAATSAWLLVQILRRLGLAARFVSGYLIQLKPDLKALDGRAAPRRISPICMPGPRSTCPAPAGSASIRPRACSPARATCRSPRRRIPHPPRRSPARSSFAEVDFSFDMQVTRIAESPRVTLPFSDEAWQALDALGHAVDARSRRAGRAADAWAASRLSFRSTTIEGEEWNTAAVGPTKRGARRRADPAPARNFAPGGFLHYGQGKWYPGESLPRWAFSLYWRKDGEPIWKDPALIAPEPMPPQRTPRPAVQAAPQAGPTVPTSSASPKAWRRGSASSRTTSSRPMRTPRIGCWPRPSCPTMPIRSIPSWPIRRRGPAWRASSSAASSGGRLCAAGAALECRGRVAAGSASAGASGATRLFLVPGDSPLGFRMPLTSLPRRTAGELPAHRPADPTAPRGSLPARAALAERPARPRRWPQAGTMRRSRCARSRAPRRIASSRSIRR